eukprot:Clim_evm58s119 gene=Clim_evmTU58s119
MPAFLKGNPECSDPFADTDRTSRGVFSFVPDENEKTVPSGLRTAASETAASYLIDNLQRRLKAIHTQQTQQYLRGVCDFVQFSSSQEFREGELATALVHIGANLADHDHMYECLQDLLLSSSDRPAWNVRLNAKWQSTPQAMLREVINTVDPSKILGIVSLTDLHNAAKREVLDRMHLVVTFEDFESFPASSLDSLILALARHSGPHLRISLIICVSTSYLAVQKYLPWEVFRQLSTKRFRMPLLEQRMRTFVDEALIKYPGKELSYLDHIRLVPELLQEIFNYCLEHSTSLIDLVSATSLAMLEHVMQQPAMDALGVDMDALSSEEREEWFGKMMAIPSVHDAFKALPASAKKKYMEKESLLQAYLVTELDKVIESHRCLPAIIWFAQKMLEAADVGASVRSTQRLYLALIRRDQSLDTAPLMQGFLSEARNMWAPAHVAEYYDKINRILQEDEAKYLAASLLEPLQELWNSHEKAVHTLKSHCDINHTDEGDVEDHARKRGKTNEGRIRRSQMVVAQQACRNQLLETITKTCSLLQKFSPRAHPMSCLFYIGSINHHAIARPLQGRFHKTLQTALVAPGKALKCKDCGGLTATSVEAILPHMPDICVAYKLHLEFGKYIPLQDWLKSFIIEMDPDAPTKDPLESKNISLLQARFSRALADLQHLGFVKATKQDHVCERLRWGAI